MTGSGVADVGMCASPPGWPTLDASTQDVDAARHPPSQYSLLLWMRRSRYRVSRHRDFGKQSAPTIAGAGSRHSVRSLPVTRLRWRRLEGQITPGILGAPGGPAPSASNFYFATLAMSWELDIWGRIRRATEAARATLLATEDARRGVWLTLVSDLAQAYFELLELDVLLQIARNSTDAYQRTYDLFLDRLQLGVASKLETSRAQGALGNAQATIPQFESDIVAKENQIAILLGKSPGPILRGTPMYDQPVVPVVPAGLPSTLLTRRPDLRQAEQQLVSANARIGAAKAEFFPKFGLTPLIGTARPEFSALTGGSATVWAVAGTLTGPLFNAGRTLGNYRATVAQWEQAKLLYEQAVLTALREVSDALTALSKLSEAETGQDRSVKALADAVDRATDRYRQGLANYFEVLEAQQQLYPAQNTLAQIRRDRLLSHVRLYRALGGGWSLTDAQWQKQRGALTTEGDQR